MGSISRLREHRVETIARGVTGLMGWISSKLGNAVVSRKNVVSVGLLLVSACFLVLWISDSSVFLLAGGGDFDCPSLPFQIPPSHQDPGRSLVESIRKARRAAASGTVDVDSPLSGPSPEALDAWNDQHPCQSRRPNGLLSFYNRSESEGQSADSVRANSLWEEVFEEYSNLHRECTQKVGDIGNYFLQKNSSSGCKFLVADVANTTEFGQKILVLASSLLYAILTQRVILIPGSTLVPSYMCEPFAGSSWLLDDSSSSSAFLSNPHSKHWGRDRDIYRASGRYRGTCLSSSLPNASAQPPYYAAAGIGVGQWQPQERFYCPREQDVYAEATFVYLSGFIYTVPKFFASPGFRPALEALFPDRIVLTHLLRSAFLPGNRVWKRVKALHHGYLQPAHRRIGIELRYNGIHGMPRFKSMSKTINRRVTDCLIQSDILPNYTNTWEARAVHLPTLAEPTRINRVLVSSLFLGLKDHLARIYERNPTLTGEAVGVVQLVQSHSELQNFGGDADFEAFSEALLLSFSDRLLVTPMSALGSVAQAYGALIPWFIDVRKDFLFKRYGTCQRAQTLEVCNYFASKKLSCSPSIAHGQVMSAEVPYIRSCLAIDHDDGIQLMTS